MIDVAKTISRRAEIKQAHLWRVLVHRESFSRRVCGMLTAGCYQTATKQRSHG